MGKTRHLVVGASLVGMPVALDLKKKFGDDVEIEMVDKRLQPGGRPEVLLLQKPSLDTLPADVQRYLFEPDEHKAVKAMLAKNVCHLTGQITEEPHAIVKIDDLEIGLTQAVQKRGITIHRGLEFLGAANFKASFIDVTTGERVEKEYDELTLAIGLSGVHSHRQPTTAPFEIPRLLHSFPAIVARFPANFQNLDPTKEPTSVVYFTKDRMVGFFITPDMVGMSVSVPANLANTLATPAAQLAFVQQSLEHMPAQLRYYVKQVNLQQPEALKSVPAVATLTPKLLDAENHIYFVGDMVATFPYVWGSETNLAYNYFVPELLKLFGQLRHCSADDRPNLLSQYEAAVKQIITTNKFFHRLLPFGETIRLGKMIQVDGMPQYQFTGWSELSRANPYSREDRDKIMPIHELMPGAAEIKEATASVKGVQQGSSVSVTDVGIYKPTSALARVAVYLNHLNSSSQNETPEPFSPGLRR